MEHEFTTRNARPNRKMQNNITQTESPHLFFLFLALFTDNVYRRCLANGTWALKGNYSMCKAILHEEVRLHVHVSRLMRLSVKIPAVWSLLYVNHKQTKARVVVEEAALLEAYWSIYSKYEFRVCLPADTRAKSTENTTNRPRASL